MGLIVVCTVGGFLTFFALIGEIGPMRAIVITYLNPAVAVLLGVVVLGEPFGPATAVGFVLVLSGSVLATRPLRSRAVAELAERGSTGAAPHGRGALRGALPLRSWRGAPLDPTISPAASAGLVAHGSHWSALRGCSGRRWPVVASSRPSGTVRPPQTVHPSVTAGRAR